MKARLAATFPFVLAAALPLAGAALAVRRYVEGQREEARWVLMSAAIGLLIWLIALGKL